MTQPTASLHRLSLSYALEWLVLSRKWRESMLIRPTRPPLGKMASLPWGLTDFLRLSRLTWGWKWACVHGVMYTEPYLTEDKSEFNDELNYQVKRFCRINSTWKSCNYSLSIYSFEWLNGCDGNITGQELSVLYLCTCLCPMSSMAPNIFNPISPPSLFLCILCVLIGLAELTVTRPWRVHHRFVSPRNTCKLELLLTVWNVCVLWLRGKYMRITCFMQFQLSLLLRLFYYCQLSKYTSAPLDSSQCLTAWMIRLLPLPSHQILLHRHLCCFATASGQAIWDGNEKSDYPLSPNPFLLSSFPSISVLLQQSLLQRWDTWWPPLTHLSQKQRFKSWSETQNRTKHKKDEQ